MRIWVGFPGGDEKCSKEHRRHKRHRFHPWVGKIPWRSEWLPTPVFFPGKVHGKAVRGATAYWVARVGDNLETKPPWLIHIVLWLKPTQHCKAIILQFEKKRNKQTKKELSLQKKEKPQTELFSFWRKDSKFREFSCKGASSGGLQKKGPGEATWEGTHIGLESYTSSLADR